MYNTRNGAQYVYTVSILHCKEINHKLQAINSAPNIYYITHVVHPGTGNVCIYLQLSVGNIPNQTVETRITSFTNKIGRLATGVDTIIPKIINTIDFIQKTEVPEGRTVIIW